MGDGELEGAAIVPREVWQGRCTGAGKVRILVIGDPSRGREFVYEDQHNTEAVAPFRV